MPEQVNQKRVAINISLSADIIDSRVKNTVGEISTYKITIENPNRLFVTNKGIIDDYIKAFRPLTSKRGRSRFSHMMMPISCNVEVDTKLGEYIETMLEAMFMHKKIQFQYTEINDNMEKVLRREGKVYILNLYTIYGSDNNYYLIGSRDNHEGLTSYRLDRVENLTIKMIGRRTIRQVF